MLRPGDIVLTENPWFLGKAIIAVEKFYSLDQEANYGHAKFVLDVQGNTFEALWTTKKTHIDRCKGKNVLIGRHKEMTDEKFQQAWQQIQDYDGNWYPLHRLFMFIVPPLAKISLFDWAVCSELVAKMLYEAGLLDFWSGIMPSDLEDMILYWKDFEIVYQGRWV
jgi:hypothetical protein